jgi:hypothetical protein
MDLQLTGKVIEVLDEQSGEGRNGPWRKQEFILETEEQYPKPVCIVQWGDNIDSFGIAKGATLTVHVDIQSREFNGRRYTDVKAWKVERKGGTAERKGGGAPDRRGPRGAALAGEPEPAEPGSDDFDDDDLPF